MQFSVRCLVISAIALLFIPTAQGQVGQTGLAFLKMGVGARAAGMGGAYTAVTNDATALYWNPAGMTATVGRDASFVHTQWFQGISHEFIGGIYSNGTTALGIGFAIMSVDGIERRADIPTLQPLATFSAYDVALSASVARRVTPSLTLGITTKAITEKILFNSASGVAFDLGAQYATAYEGLTLGAVIRNLGPSFSFIQEKFSLPREVRLGVGYVPPHETLRRNLLLSADLSKYRNDPTRLNLGAEYSHQARFSATAGYQARQSEAGFSAGLGFRMPKYRLDYAFVPFGAGLGNTHRFALGYRF
jgi:hypothetical protein